MLPYSLGFHITQGGISTYYQTILADGPIGYWRCDEASGAIYDTASGNWMQVGTGLTYEQTSLLPNDNNKCIKLDGTANGEFHRSNTVLYQLKSDMFFEIWVKLNSISTDQVLGECAGATGDGDSTDNYLYRYRLKSDNKFELFWEYTDGTIGINVFATSTDAAEIATNTVYHFAFSRDATAKTAIFYINGVPVESGISYSNNPSHGTDADFTVGKERQESTGRWFLDAYVDEVALYDNKLTSAKALTHYRKGIGSETYEDQITYDAPIAYWRMDEASGSITDEISSVVLVAGGGETYETTGLITDDDNKAIDFDGTTSAYFYKDNHAAYQLIGDMSFECWVELDAISQQHYFVTCTGATGDSDVAENTVYSFYIDATNKLHVLWEYAGGADEDVVTTSAISISADTKTHLAFSRDVTNNKVNFYVDGELEESVSYTNDPVGGGNADFYISTMTSISNHLDGTLDEVALYNKIVPIHTFRLHYTIGA